MLLWQDLPLQRGMRARRAEAGGPPGHRCGRPPRPPPLDRGVVRPQRAAGRRARPGDARRSERPSPRRPLGHRGPRAAHLEQDRPRPLGEARPRASRRQPPGRRPLRGAPPPTAARRHGQPPVPRLVPRRRARPPRAAPRRAAPRPVRERARCPGRAHDRGLLRAGALARPRLGPAGERPRDARGGVRSGRPTGLATLPSRTGRPRPRPTRPRSSAGRSRPSAGSSTGRAAGSRRCSSPMPSPPSPSRCSTTSGCPRPASTR